MSFLIWNLVLLVMKWVLIALIFAVLMIILFTVKREMSLRLRSPQPKEAVAVGRLRVVNPGGDSRLIPGLLLNLRADTRLGAASDNDILFNSPFISGHHARLTWDGAAWWVEDLGSRNGTLAAGRPCLARTPQPLSCGVPLQVGDITVELVEAE